jgi:hypothetical protein
VVAPSGAAALNSSFSAAFENFAIKAAASLPVPADRTDETEDSAQCQTG